MDPNKPASRYQRLLDYLYDILGALSLPIILLALLLLPVIAAIAATTYWPYLIVITLLAVLELAWQKTKS